VGDVGIDLVAQEKATGEYCGIQDEAKSLMLLALIAGAKRSRNRYPW
jgi:Restriction endonuclease